MNGHEIEKGNKRLVKQDVRKYHPSYFLLLLQVITHRYSVSSIILQPRAAAVLLTSVTNVAIQHLSKTSPTCLLALSFIDDIQTSSVMSFYISYVVYFLNRL